jgi:hypothetical protein
MTSLDLIVAKTRFEKKIAKKKFKEKNKTSGT